MHKTLQSLVVVVATAVSPVALGQSAQLFSASSKAQGAPFDLTVTETERFPTKSYLNVPGFHERTAPGSRWLMCAYTAIAVQRGFTHWFVVYPTKDSDRIAIGFSNSATAVPAELLGADFSRERALGEGMAPVAKLAAFCGIKQ